MHIKFSKLICNLFCRLSYVLSVVFLAIAFVPAATYAQQFCPSNLPSPLVVKVSGSLENILIDDNCEYVYATNRLNDRVEVFSIANRRLEAPISVGSRPHGLDTSPHGDLLYVANYEGQSISVIDLDTRTEDLRIDVPTESETTDDWPYSIAVTNTGLVLFSTSGIGSRIMQADPAQDYEVTTRTDYGKHLGSTSRRTILRASKDRRKVIVLRTGTYPASIYRYDSATDDFGDAKRLLPSFQDVATDGIGAWTLLHPGPYVLNPDFNQIGSKAYGGRLGAAVHPDGDVGFMPWLSGDIVVLSLESMSIIGSMDIGDTIDLETSRMAISSDETCLR